MFLKMKDQGSNHILYRQVEQSKNVHDITKLQEHTADACGIRLSSVKFKWKISQHHNLVALVSVGMTNCHLATTTFEPWYSLF
jgi:hypothetical protein